MTEYEFEVGRRIYEKSLTLPEHLRIIPEVIELIVDKDERYLVIEYVPGVNLNSIFHSSGLSYIVNGVNKSPDYASSDSHRKKLLDTRFYRMLRTIHEFQKATGFTHYDLHFGNIITNDNLQTFKLIDFELSHYPGHTGWVTSSDVQLMIGVVPSVADTWFDLARLIVIFHQETRQPIPFAVQTMLEENQFNTKTFLTDFSESELLTMPILNWSRLYPGAEIIPDMKIVPRVHSSMWDGGMLGHGFWVSDGDRTDTPSFTSYQEHQIESKVRFGESLANIKKRAIQQRPHRNAEELLRLLEAASPSRCEG